jgi:hypothetical protein
MGEGDAGQDKLECQSHSECYEIERCIKSSGGRSGGVSHGFQGGMKNERSIEWDVAMWRCGEGVRRVFG